MQLPDGWDEDWDGHGGSEDCDPEDRAVHYGADEICDGIDNDCDGRVDETCILDVALGTYQTCALSLSGSVDCWGFGASPPANADERYSLVRAGFFSACALTSLGSLECWGTTGFGLEGPPADAMRDFDLGTMRGCGVMMDGTLSCWGQSTQPPPSGEFIQVACAGGETLALRADGRVEVWGSDVGALAQVPDVRLRSLDAAGGHACGVTESFEIVCWGEDLDGEVEAPSGAFVEVSAGGHHFCAISLGGRVECWGSNNSGQIEAPPMSFTRIDSYGDTTCGVVASGCIECWGSCVWEQCDAGCGG